MKIQTVFRIKIICLNANITTIKNETEFPTLQQEEVKEFEEPPNEMSTEKPEINIKKWVINQQRQERRINMLFEHFLCVVLLRTIPDVANSLALSYTLLVCFFTCINFIPFNKDFKEIINNKKISFTCSILCIQCMLFLFTFNGVHWNFFHNKLYVFLYFFYVALFPVDVF